MKTVFFRIALGAVFLMSPVARGEDRELEEAVAETQKSLRSAKDRKSLIQSQDAQKANDDAASLVGKENVDDIYNISAEILPGLMQSQGTPDKAALHLEAAKQNPQDFLEKLPPDIQKKIKNLADKVENKNQQNLNKKTP